MKRIATALGAVSIAIAGLALAPLANAEQAPVSEGPHTFIWSDGAQSQVTVAYDCGPDCFTMGNSSRMEFRFDGARWVTPGGASTVDGRNFLNKNGDPGTLI